MCWEMSGTYVGNCTCQLICPCPVDGMPTGPDGECRGLNVFHIAKGNLDDTDLSGVDFAFLNWFPTDLTAGGWKVGAVVDDAATDAQAGALETILRGQAGGPFVSLMRCRSPMDFILHRMRPGYSGALRMGVEHGAWCVACCWALMTALFALGVMSLGWMALIGAFIAGEKMLPWKCLANRSVAVALAVIALGVALTPAAMDGMGMSLA